MGGKVRPSILKQISSGFQKWHQIFRSLNRSPKKCQNVRHGDFSQIFAFLGEISADHFERKSFLSNQMLTKRDKLGRFCRKPQVHISFWSEEDCGRSLKKVKNHLSINI